MTRRNRTPLAGQLDPDAPLRLSIAASVAFPDGSMTVSGLRREGHRGKLIVERIAGKDYTTLAHIARMRDLCRVEQRAPISGFAQNVETNSNGQSRVPHGSSSTADDSSPQDALRAKLNARKSS
jgi:hypothetical protein